MCQLLTSPLVLSRPFSFIVDADEVLIVVCEAAVADQFPAPDSLIRGETLENLAGEAKWNDPEEETFLWFIEFVYSGDYLISQSSIIKSSEQHP